MMWKYGSPCSTLWLSGTKWWWESLALHTPHCACRAGTPMTTRIARDCCFCRVFSNCKRYLVPDFLRQLLCVHHLNGNSYFSSFLMMAGRWWQWVTGNRWSADAVPLSGRHLQMTVRPRSPSLLPVCSGPRSQRRKWGCQDPLCGSEWIRHNKYIIYAW